MVIIQGLTVSYGKVQVIKDLTLTIEKSTIHGLVGLNGSGKTTLLNTIYGLKSSEKGSIVIEGERKDRNIGYLESENFFYPRISGYEYLQLFQTQNKNFSIENWNNLFELPLEKMIDEYSTGMKKKLALMGIICLDREFLILDEPFNGVDMETVQKMKSLLMKLKQNGKTILITSHILESLTGICDCISYLNKSRIEFSKNKSEFTDIESAIFSIHQGLINTKIDELLK
jgi:ABC-2 type transport system ATP-binding protein